METIIIGNYYCGLNDPKRTKVDSIPSITKPNSIIGVLRPIRKLYLDSDFSSYGENNILVTSFQLSSNEGKVTNIPIKRTLGEYWKSSPAERKEQGTDEILKKDILINDNALNTIIANCDSSCERASENHTNRLINIISNLKFCETTIIGNLNNPNHFDDFEEKLTKRGFTLIKRDIENSISYIAVPEYWEVVANYKNEIYSRIYEDRTLIVEVKPKQMTFPQR